MSDREDLPLTISARSTESKSIGIGSSFVDSCGKIRDGISRIIIEILPMVISLFQSKTTEFERHHHLCLDVGQHRQRTRRETLIELRLGKRFLHHQRGRRGRRRTLFYVDVRQWNRFNNELRRILLIEHSKISKKNRRRTIRRGRNHVRINDDTRRYSFTRLTQRQDDQDEKRDGRHVQ